jgi:hypothetical protein
MPPSTEPCLRCGQPAELPAGQQRFRLRLCRSCLELLSRDAREFCRVTGTKREGVRRQGTQSRE